MAPQHPKHLSALSWNCNGVAGKTHHLELLSYLLKPDIIAIQESKLTPSFLHSEILPRYTIYRRDRVHGNGRGGGVLIAISDSSRIKVLQIYIDPTSKSYHLTWNFMGSPV